MPAESAGRPIARTIRQAFEQSIIHQFWDPLQACAEDVPTSKLAQLLGLDRSIVHRWRKSDVLEPRLLNFLLLAIAMDVDFVEPMFPASREAAIQAYQAAYDHVREKLFPDLSWLPAPADVLCLHLMRRHEGWRKGQGTDDAALLDKSAKEIVEQINLNLDGPISVKSPRKWVEDVAKQGFEVWALLEEVVSYEWFA